MLKRGVWVVLLLLIFCGTAFGAKEKLVLLPLQGKGLSATEKKLYQNAIKSELSKKYKIYSGEEVEAKLKKFAITSCTSHECLEQIAIAFNGHLVGRGYVMDSNGTPLLGLEIKDIFTNEDVFSESRGCKGCDGSGIIEMFKSMASGRSTTGAVAYVSQAVASGSASGNIVRVTPKVSDNTGSKIAALFFDSDPAGATVYLGDTIAGTCPYQNLSLKPGQTIQVMVKKEGYYDKKVALTLSGGTNELGTLKLKSKYGKLVIHSNPSGAEVIIAGKKVGSTPYTDEKVLSGAYLVSLRKDLYFPVENRRVVVRAEEVTRESYHLTANYGTLALASVPNGVSFTLKNEKGKSVRSGTTPATIQAMPGVYTLDLNKEGYAPLDFNVTLARDKTLAIDDVQASLRKLQGDVIVSSEPYIKGAKVWVDGREAGVLPLSLTLAAGFHEIEVKTEDKVGRSRVTVKDGGSTVVKVVLEDAKGRPFTNSLGMTFVWIEPGTFMMGSPSLEWMRDSDETLHRVSLTKGFYIQTTEVTVGQWRRFIQETGYKTEAETDGGASVWSGSWWKKKRGVYWDNPGFSQSDECPVTCVSWNDAQRFIGWLNRKVEGHYRLPTEAQWEYACRAESTGPFAFGDCFSTSQANYDGNRYTKGCSKGCYLEKTAPVARYEPNVWGVYDMHGNVWERCQDRYEEYSSGTVTDPVGPSSGDLRVLRGGSWFDGAWGCRSAVRGRGEPSSRSNYIGFRILRGPE